MTEWKLNSKAMATIKTYSQRYKNNYSESANLRVTENEATAVLQQL